MDTEFLLSIKALPDCNIFNESTLNEIKLFFKESNIKYVKKNKKNNNVLKNSNFNLKKNKVSNKIIFILNKLSETNIDNIIIEFIQSIKIDTIDTYNNIIENIFQKILKDSKFISIYCEFFIKIIKYNYIKYKFEPTYLFNLIDIFIEDYNDKCENDRLVFLSFIVNMEKNNFLQKNIIKYISSIIINLKLIPDLKFWFNYYNLNKDCLKGFNIKNTRDKLIYQSIFENNTNNTKKSQNNDSKIIKINKIDIFKNQCENIIEEYNYMNLNDDIIFFIENECCTDDYKFDFIEYIIKQYISKKKNNILELFEYIISNNIINQNIIKNVLIKINKSTNSPNIDKLTQSLKKNNINININI